ncbi:MAG: aldo/keto reductase [Oscillospiraceae bacterium]
MKTVTLGRTNISVNRNGFGALPIQRDSHETAQYLLRKAYDNGIRFFDTSRVYSDSEEKIGNALSDVRANLILATKTPAVTAAEFRADLETSLKVLKTDYIDIYQFHNTPFCPMPNDGTGLYEAMLEAKAEGKIKFIGITNHRIHVATQAAECGLYDTIQFPFSYLATENDIALVNLCRRNNVGFIAMKGLSGGLITRADAAYAYLSQYDNTLPIWGIQRESELDEFLSFNDNPPVMTEEIKSVIEADRRELCGDFCRGCGYCMPCPQGIEINNCNRMSLMLRRAPVPEYTTAGWIDKMNKIEDCINCGQCMTKCPYNLKIPELLKKNLADFRTFL